MAGFVVGRNASFTYTSGNETLVTASFLYYAFKEEVSMHPATPFGYTLDHFEPGTRRVSGALGTFFNAAGATLPSPAPSGTTIGTLTLLLNSGDSKSFPASLFRLSGNPTMQGSSPTQIWEYGFISNAVDANSVVTTA